MGLDFLNSLQKLPHMSAITNLRAPESLQMGTAAMKLKDVCSLEGKL